MKNKFSIFPIISLFISIIALVLYVLVIYGAKLHWFWLLFSVASMAFPFVSKYFRNKKDAFGKSIEITAVVIGAFDLYFLFFAATKINIYVVYLLIAAICVLYAKLFNNVSKKAVKIEDDKETEVLETTPMDSTLQTIDAEKNDKKHKINVKKILIPAIAIVIIIPVLILSVNYFNAQKTAENAVAICLSLESDDHYFDNFTSFQKTYCTIEFSDFKYVVELSGSAYMGRDNKKTSFYSMVEIDSFSGDAKVCKLIYDGKKIKK
ncbi:MAG: hypothetical protein IKT42_07365 [Clostridia bacterium]|nr:hypothetical protein [Clostridia bacterium]